MKTGLIYKKNVLVYKKNALIYKKNAPYYNNDGLLLLTNAHLSPEPNRLEIRCRAVLSEALGRSGCFPFLPKKR